MTLSLGLLLYGALLAGGAPLIWGGWARRSPRWGVVVLCTLLVTAVASTVLAAGVAVLPVPGASGTFDGFLGGCAQALRAAFATPGAAARTTAALVVAAVVAVRAVGCVLVQSHRSRRARTRHLATVRLLARRHPRYDMVLVEHGRPAVYCLPGQGGTVVATRAAVDVLDDRQLLAVLAHEQAHLQGRHHLLVTLVVGLRRAFPRVPLFELAAREMPPLVELLADDMAARGAARTTIAAAMLALAGGSAPATSLGAAEGDVVHRVERLLQPARPLRAPVVIAIATASVLSLLLPVLVVADPAGHVLRAISCPWDGLAGAGTRPAP